MININEQNTKVKITGLSWDRELGRLNVQYNKGYIDGVFIKTNEQPICHQFTETAFNNIIGTSVNGTLGSVLLQAIKSQLASDLGGTL